MSDDEVARLRRAVLRLARRLRTLSAEEGLTPAQSGLLATLVREGPRRLSDLAVSEGVNPTMLSRMIGALEELGLVARAPDPEDRRVAWARATPDGRRRIARVRARHGAALAGLLEGLQEEDVERLRTVLPVLETLASADTAVRR